MPSSRSSWTGAMPLASLRLAEGQWVMVVRVRFRDPPLLGGEPDPVGQDHVVPGEAELVQEGHVGESRTRADQLDLAAILRRVGVEQRPPLPGLLHAAPHRLPAGRQHEPGREGVAEAALGLSVPALAQPHALGDGVLGGLLERRGVAFPLVHERLAPGVAQAQARRRRGRARWCGGRSPCRGSRWCLRGGARRSRGGRRPAWRGRRGPPPGARSGPAASREARAPPPGPGTGSGRGGRGPGPGRAWQWSPRRRCAFRPCAPGSRAPPPGSPRPRSRRRGARWCGRRRGRGRGRP